MQLVTAELWRKCINAAIKYEEKFWERDRMVESELPGEFVSNPNMVIRSNDWSSESESSNSSESDSEEDEFDWN